MHKQCLSAFISLFLSTFQQKKYSKNRVSLYITFLFALSGTGTQMFLVSILYFYFDTFLLVFFRSLPTTAGAHSFINTKE